MGNPTSPRPKLNKPARRGDEEWDVPTCGRVLRLGPLAEPDLGTISGLARLGPQSLELSLVPSLQVRHPCVQTRCPEDELGVDGFPI